MLFKSFPVFLTLLGSICANSAANETVATKTNTIVKPELLSTVQEIFANNPPHQTAGIEVVIVYECAGPKQPQQPLAISPVNTFVTTSQIAYTVSTQVTNTKLSTVCNNQKCEVSTVKQVVPSTFKSTAQVTYTTTGTTKATNSGDPADPVNTSDPSDSKDPTTSSKSNAGVVTIPTAKTTTSTLFHTSQPQNSTFSVPTSKQTITTTEKNPVSTNAPVSSSVSVTINTSSFTKPLTLSAAANSTYTIATTGQSKTAYSNATIASIAQSSESTLSSSQASAAQISENQASATYSNGTHISTTSSESLTAQITPISSQYTTMEVTKNSTFISYAQYSNSSQNSYPVTYVASELVNVTVPVSVSSTALSSESSSLFRSSSVVSSSIENVSSGAKSSSSSSIGSSSVVSSSTPAMNTPNVNTIVSSNSNNYNGDAFNVISTENPPTVFARQELPLAIPDGVDNNGSPIQTNKFYANLFLGDQTDMIWSWPYGMLWSKVNYYGFGVQHTNISDRQFGSQDTNNAGVPSYYFNPVGTSEIIFSSTSLSSDNNHLFVSDMESMSVNVKLASSSSLGSDYIELPIVQGMGFVTAIYHGDMVPLLNSLIGIQTFTKETSSVLNSSTLKYRATLFNGVEWLIYVTLPSSSTSFELDVKNPFNIEGSSAVDGLVIQVAVAPETSNLQKRDGTSMDGYYDQSSGQYVTSADIVGTVSSGVAAQYGFQYTTEGSSSCGSPIVFALPHHVDSLTASTSQLATGIRLASTTKGYMYAYLTDKLMMSETLETDIQFLPWSKQMSKALSYSPEQLVLLAKTANDELQVDIASSVGSMDSNYFSGKVLDKYAYILLVLHEIIQDEEVTKATLKQMKDAFDLFINNKQYYPLMYDTKFGGVTSTSAQGGDTGADFGSAYYNDHHFHYGYFVHAAAVVGKVDKDLGGNWAETNKDWVNSLVRDVANPSKSDPHFPVYRMFDWFAGHSWAAGLFASGDGKNQESSSEDYNFAYGMKLWGKVIGNDAMESRGDLMLAVMARAMNKYILYSDDNAVEPSAILPNKVAGIIFENKIAYTTYFGSPNAHPEYVHGIHMLPITPASSLIRNPTFVQQEWKEQVATFINNVDSGWTGILKLNQALYDPDASYDFFSSSSWSSGYLDNGQSRTWSLAYAGGVSNSV